MKLILFSVLLVTCLPILIFGQEMYDFVYTINSDYFEEERTFYIHVPEDYYKDSTVDYNVVFVLDAQAESFYNNAKGIIDYLVWSYQIMPTIVVGVSSNNRGTEFVPLDKQKPGDDPANNGQAHLLTSHIQNEIMALVEREFRIRRPYVLIGHSRGGAFVANTLFSEHKDVFDAYIGISPAMHYLDKQILQMAEHEISTGSEFNKFFFCSYGTVGTQEAYFGPQVEYLDSLFYTYPNQTIQWEKKKFNGLSHWGVVAPSLVYGIQSMSRAYKADQYLIEQFAKNNDKNIADQLESYYIDQKDKLGISFKLDFGDLRYYAEQQAEFENYKSASELFKLALIDKQNDARANIGLANALRELKEYDAAVLYYKRVLEVLKENEMNWSESKINAWSSTANEAILELMKYSK